MAAEPAANVARSTIVTSLTPSTSSSSSASAEVAASDRPAGDDDDDDDDDGSVDRCDDVDVVLCAISLSTAERGESVANTIDDWCGWRDAVGALAAPVELSAPSSIGRYATCNRPTRRSDNDCVRACGEGERGISKAS